MTARTIPKPPSRDAWLDARRPYVGASDAACLVGAHPFKTLAELAYEKLSGDDGPDSPAMARGRRLEAVVADWYADETGRTIFEPDVLYVDQSGALCSTLDRIDTNGTRLGVEVKTTNAYVAEPAAYWLVQAQAQIVCADLVGVDLAVLDSTLQLSVFHVEPDETLGAELVKRAGEFLSFIRRGEYPPDLPLDYATAKKLHPPETATADEVDLDNETYRYVRVLDTIRGRIAVLDKEADALQAIIAHRLGDATIGTYEGRRVVTWKPVAAKRLDQAALRAKYPEIVAEFTEPAPYRRMYVGTASR